MACIRLASLAVVVVFPVPFTPTMETTVKPSCSCNPWTPPVKSRNFTSRHTQHVQAILTLGSYESRTALKSLGHGMPNRHQSGKLNLLHRVFIEFRRTSDDSSNLMRQLFLCPLQAALNLSNNPILRRQRRFHCRHIRVRQLHAADQAAPCFRRDNPSRRSPAIHVAQPT